MYMNININTYIYIFIVHIYSKQKHIRKEIAHMIYNHTQILQLVSCMPSRPSWLPRGSQDTPSSSGVLFGSPHQSGSRPTACDCRAFFGTFWDYMAVSINGDNPKCIVYNGQSIKILLKWMIWGYPFQETSI